MTDLGEQFAFYIWGQQMTSNESHDPGWNCFACRYLWSKLQGYPPEPYPI